MWREGGGRDGFSVGRTGRTQRQGPMSGRGCKAVRRKMRGGVMMMGGAIAAQVMMGGILVRIAGTMILANLVEVVVTRAARGHLRPPRIVQPKWSL